MFAERLKDLRKSYNLTQAEFAKKFHIASGTIAMWETGKRQPDAETVKKIAGFFKVSVDYLLDNHVEAEEIACARQTVQRLCEEQAPAIPHIENVLGVSYATFRTWLSGYGDYFNNAAGLSKLAELFSVSVDYLLGRSEDTPLDEQLSEEEFALFGEVHDLTSEEKKRVLDFIKFTKSQREE